VAHRSFAFLPVLLALVGCGYALVDYPDRDTALALAVQTFENESYEPGYEMVVVDALRREVARRGAMRLVDDAAGAEVVLRGRVADIATSGRSFSSVVSTLEFAVGVSLDLELVRPGTEIGIDRRALRARESYLASADIEVQRKNRDEALRKIAVVLAARIHDVIWEVAPP
jgi:hypothetical protein